MKLRWIVQKVCFFGVADEFVGLNPVISAGMSGYYVSSGRRGRVRRLDGRPGAQGGRGTVQCSTRQNERAFLTERRFVALPCGASDGINLLVLCWGQLDRMTVVPDCSVGRFSILHIFLPHISFLRLYVKAYYIICCNHTSIKCVNVVLCCYM